MSTVNKTQHIIYDENKNEILNYFETSADQVKATDGNTLQTKVGVIKGITTSTSVTTQGYAADATTVNQLNSNIVDVNSNLGKFGTPVDIANTIGQYYGFIPAVDGIVELVINPADANPAYYVVLSNDGFGSKSGTWARVNSFNGFEASISFPVRAGVTYKKSAAVNCTERIIYIPNK